MAISLKNIKNDTSFLTPEQKKQKKMVGLLIVVVMAIAAVVYFGYFKDTEAPSPAAGASSVGAIGATNRSSAILMEEAAKNFKNRNFIYQDKRFIELKMHGDLPVVVGEKGRENPFIPF